jgi:putative PEP-CTERM system TPR-repeat lipoprotein
MKRLTKYYQLILFVWIVLITGCSVGISEDERFKGAQSNYEQGKYSEAIIGLKNILQANAGHQGARVLLAKCYLAIGDGGSAEKELNRLKEPLPNSQEMDWMKLASWEMQGKYKEIVEIYEKGELSGSEEPQIKQILSNAYVNQKKPELADKLALELLQQDQDSVPALVLRANVASIRDDHAAAIEHLNKAIALDGSNHKVWRVLGGIQIKLQQYDHAIESLMKAVSITQPNDSKQQQFLTKVTLIQLLVQRSRQEESLKYLEELKKDYSSNPIVMHLSGLHHYIAGQYDTAKTELMQVNTKYPDHLPTMLLLGAIHFSENNLEQANRLLTRYVNRVPTHLQARKLLGEIKLRLNKPKDALSLLKSTKEQQRDSEILSMIGIAASYSGNYTEGIEYLKKAVKEHPEDTRIREELARLYLNRGEVDEAINELEQLEIDQDEKTTGLLILSYLRKQDFNSARKLSDQVLSSGQDHSATDYYLRALVEMTSGNRREARNFFTKATQENPEYTIAQIALGRMDLEDSKLSESRDRLNLVLTKEPENTHALMLLAQISERSGQQKQALKWLEKAARSKYNNVVPRVILVRYYLRARQPDKAAAYLDDKGLRNSKNPDILSLIAEMDEQLGRHKEAKTILNKIIDLYPNLSSTYLQLANLHKRQGDLEAARKTLGKMEPMTLDGKFLLYQLELEDKHYAQAETIARELMSEPETKYRGVALLAQAMQAQGQVQKAVDIVKKHLSSDAPFYLVRKLTDLYLVQGKIDDAVAELKRRIQDEPEGNKEAEMALAMVYQSHGRNEEALEVYQRLLSKDSDNIVILNNLALLLFDIQPKEALQYARKAYSRVGDASFAVVDTYAWLTHQSGDTKTALELMTPILTRTTDPSIHYHYAAMLAVSGKKGEALEILLKVFENNQKFHESEEAKQLLSELSS